MKEHSTSCNHENKGLLRMAALHLEFCDGKSWVRLLDKKMPPNSSDNSGQRCSYLIVLFCSYTDLTRTFYRVRDTNACQRSCFLTFLAMGFILGNNRQ